MKILTATAGNIQSAATTIRKGGLGVYPTDTVYGLLADATNQKAVNKVFNVKERPKTKPLPIFIKSLAMAKKVARINKEQEKFLKDSWPGKVTAVLQKKGSLKMYGIDKETIALRIPDYEPLNNLLDLIKVPLVQTSANLSGKDYRDPKKNINEFKDEKPDIIVLSGKSNNKSSTIIDLTVDPPAILR